MSTARTDVGRGARARAAGLLLVLAVLPVQAQPFEATVHDDEGDVRPSNIAETVDLPQIDILRVAGNVPTQGAIELALELAGDPGEVDYRSPDNTTLTHTFLVDRAPGSGFGNQQPWDLAVECRTAADAPGNTTCEVIGSNGSAAAPRWEGRFMTVRVFFPDTPEETFEHLDVAAVTRQSREAAVMGEDYTDAVDPFSTGGDDQAPEDGSDAALWLRWGIVVALGILFLILWQRHRRLHRRKAASGKHAAQRGKGGGRK